MTAVTDALGNVTRYAYDALDNLILSVDPNGGETRYAYDAMSRLISVSRGRFS
jgi:YD repeat-containing protein